jgi:3-isopropylmalate/(R)-2-methylmalate dehydratase large subunit
MTTATTLFDKIWDEHVVYARDDGWVLLYIDRIFLHEGSHHAFGMLDANGHKVRRPGQCFAVADHLVPTRGQSGGIAAIENPNARRAAEAQVKYTQRHGIQLFGLGNPSQGIVHVVGPEQGISQPGLTVICGDSHTSTHGALGAFGFGVGNSEVAHALATQTLWSRKPRTMRIVADGSLQPGVTAKDLVLAVIRRIGTAGATEHVIEFAGSAIRELGMAGRLTVCNMSIEAGARAGMVAPDEKTIAYLEGRPHAPKGADWKRAVELWSALKSDPDSTFDAQVELDGSALEPMVTWGTSPEDAIGISERVPDPGRETDAGRRNQMERALQYMGLSPGQAATEIQIDRVFIGSCTNARIEDLREAAAILRGRRAVVPGMVVPGSAQVRRQAEQEGLAEVIQSAGLEWRESGCSMCLGMNGDILKPGERCVATSNRNFEGRQGRGGRTILASPIMAAAAALSGRLVDVRNVERRE